MASIGKNSKDTLVQLRDLYKSRERDLETRHREEIKELRVQHQTQMDKLQGETRERVETLQAESNAKLSEKDLQHQKEIESIRSMYAKRLADAKKPE